MDDLKSLTTEQEPCLIPKLHLITMCTTQSCTSSPRVLPKAAPHRHVYCEKLHLITMCIAQSCTSSACVLPKAAPHHHVYCKKPHLITICIATSCTSSPCVLLKAAPHHHMYCKKLHLITIHVYCDNLSLYPAAGDDEQVEAGCVAREKMWMTVAITET